MIQDKGVILEGFDEIGKEFDDIVLCCRHLIKQKNDYNNFIDNEVKESYKRKINLYKDNVPNVGKSYKWGFEDTQICSVILTSMEDLLVNILRNNIHINELSNSIAAKFPLEVSQLLDCVTPPPKDREKEASNFLRELLYEEV